MHHPVFKRFPSSDQNTPSGYTRDFIGNLTRFDHLQAPQSSTHSPSQIEAPAIDEEYFEWIDLLTAAASSDKSFIMLELGAGYGRWAARAYTAASRLSIPHIHIGLVEAEPAHVTWIPQHMADNRIPSSAFSVYDTALGSANSSNWFYVCMPPGSKNNSPKEWYGQGLTNGPESVVFSWKFGLSKSDEAHELEELIAPELAPLYRGREFARLLNGWIAMRTENTPLSDILRKYPHINLVDCDIQGEELNVLTEAIDELNSRVACVHIGTHSEACESGLRDLFSHAGWQNVWDYSCFKTLPTDYGSVYFNDGVQTWLNPRYRS